jgi:hypothetical protein
MFSLTISYYIIHESNLNPWSKGSHGTVQGCIIFFTQICHITFKIKFIWYVCFYPSFFQPFFGVIEPFHNQNHHYNKSWFI